MPTVECPACKDRTNAAPRVIGTQVRCHKCGQVFVAEKLPARSSLANLLSGLSAIALGVLGFTCGAASLLDRHSPLDPLGIGILAIGFALLLIGSIMLGVSYVVSQNDDLYDAVRRR